MQWDSLNIYERDSHYLERERGGKNKIKYSAKILRLVRQVLHFCQKASPAVDRSSSMRSSILSSRQHRLLFVFFFFFLLLNAFACRGRARTPPIACEPRHGWQGKLPGRLFDRVNSTHAMLCVCRTTTNTNKSMTWAKLEVSSWIVSVQWLTQGRDAAKPSTGWADNQSHPNRHCGGVEWRFQIALSEGKKKPQKLCFILLGW